MPRLQLDWKREEVILAMSFYVTSGAFAGGPIPGQSSAQIVQLSNLLKKLGAYPPEVQGEKYRNPNGVYLKLMNLRAIQAEGVHGMNAYSQLDAAVWRDFVDDLPKLHADAADIRMRLGEGAIQPAEAEPMMEDVEIEQQHTEAFPVSPTGESRVGGASGAEACPTLPRLHGGERCHRPAKKYLPAGEARPLYSDAWVEDRHALIEAKNSDSRDAIRQAIGQFTTTGASMNLRFPSQFCCRTRQMRNAWICSGAPESKQCGPMGRAFETRRMAHSSSQGKRIRSHLGQK